MICPQFRPVIGGYERAAERLSEELTRQGNEVTVITERRDTAWPKRETITGFTLLRLTCIYRPGWHMATSLLSFVFYLLFKGWKYQVFHVHQYGYHAALAVLISKLIQRPVVLKLTSTAEQGLSRAFLTHNLIIRLILVFLHKQIDACVVTSQAAREEALSFGISEDRLHNIVNGVNTRDFYPSSDQEKSSKRRNLHLKSSTVVLYVGRLSAEKNPLGLLDAWSKVILDYPSSQLIFVGDGPQLRHLKKRISTLGYEDSVIPVGARLDVLNWYQAADIYVLPSHHEGFSNSLLEAMSCGLSVVSTRVSGSEDVFSKVDIGEMVEVGDMKGFAEGIRMLLSNPERRETCGVKARTLAKARYSVEAVAKKVAEIYKNVVITRKSGLLKRNA